MPYGAPPAPPVLGASPAAGESVAVPYWAHAQLPHGVPIQPPHGVSAQQPYGAPSHPFYGGPQLSYGVPSSATYGAPSSLHYGGYQPQHYYGAHVMPYSAPSSSYSSALAPPDASPSTALVGSAPAPGGAPLSGLYAPSYATPPPPPAAHAEHAAAALGSAREPFYFAHLIPVQLTPDNYLSWRAQLLPLLRSRYLEGYVDGTLPCPSPYHPGYHAWVAQDQAILSAIQSSLSPSVGSLILFAATSREAWSALHTSFMSQSQARAHAIRTQLGEVKLLDLSITDYLTKVSGLADVLASIGQPLRPEDFTSYVLNGLDEEYDNLVENIDARETPIQPRELYSRLLATEQHRKARRSTPSFVSANAVSRGGGKPFKSPTIASKPVPPPQQPTRPANPPTGGRPRVCCPACGAQVPCQLCGIEGHTSSRCHRRFKRDFLGIGNNGKGNDKQAAFASHEQGYTPSYSIDPNLVHGYGSYQPPDE